MSQYDWSTFTKRIPIHASLEQITNAWKSQDQIEKWFLQKAEFTNINKQIKDRHTLIAPGDSYLWTWHGSHIEATGEILENANSEFLTFSFLGCVVGLKLREEADELVLELTQREIALDEDSRVSYYVGCSRGWTFYLANLKSLLEGGIDLRNKNSKLHNVINT